MICGTDMDGLVEVKGIEPFVLLSRISVLKASIYYVLRYPLFQ